VLRGRGDLTPNGTLLIIRGDEGVGERLIPLIGVRLCGVTKLGANFVELFFCELRCNV
jgi:hypothetical protein